MIWYLLAVACPVIFAICAIIAWSGTNVSTLKDDETSALGNHLETINGDDSWHLR